MRQPRSRHAGRALRGDGTRRVRSGRPASCRPDSASPERPAGSPEDSATGSADPEAAADRADRADAAVPVARADRRPGGGPGGGRGDFADRRPRRAAERLQRHRQLHLRRLGRSTPPRISCAATRSPGARPTTARTSAGRSAARSRFPASTTARARRTSRSATPATAATSSSTSTPRCPTEAMRAGNFSSRRRRQLIDPRTGLPLAGNQIPPDALSPAAARAAPLHPVAEPARRDAELPLHDDDRFGGRQLQRADHAQLHAGAGRRARRRRARRVFGGRGGPAGRGGRGQQGTTCC